MRSIIYLFFVQSSIAMQCGEAKDLYKQTCCGNSPNLTFLETASITLNQTVSDTLTFMFLTQETLGRFSTALVDIEDDPDIITLASSHSNSNSVSNGRRLSVTTLFEPVLSYVKVESDSNSWKNIRNKLLCVGYDVLWEKNVTNIILECDKKWKDNKNVTLEEKRPPHFLSAISDNILEEPIFKPPSCKNETCDTERCEKLCSSDSLQCQSCRSCMSAEEYCIKNPNYEKCQNDTCVGAACCMAMTASCLSCSMCISESEFCKLHPNTMGCDTSLCSHKSNKVCCRGKSSITNAKTCKRNTPFERWSCTETEDNCILTSNKTPLLNSVGDFIRGLLQNSAAEL
jgi:hypothetical protein